MNKRQAKRFVCKMTSIIIDQGLQNGVLKRVDIPDRERSMRLLERAFNDLAQELHERSGNIAELPGLGRPHDMRVIRSKAHSSRLIDLLKD